jgi:ubiquinone biosynthesis protein UbiJ
MPAPETPFVAALNRLLRAEPEARARLAVHAGKRFEVSAGPLPRLRFAIDASGTLSAAAADAQPDLSVRITREALTALAAEGGLPGERFVEALAVSGDRELADELGLLARHLRWDIEEPLAGLIGDVAAHRLAAAARDFATWQMQSLQRGARALSSWAAQEQDLLVGRAEFSAFRGSVENLAEAIERLAERLRTPPRRAAERESGPR